MEKESVRRVPYDIVEDARKVYRINGKPSHKDAITYEERTVASDRATCGACEKSFKKGDKAIYIEHHVDKDKNPYHINRKHVCYDCAHLDAPNLEEVEPSQGQETSTNSKLKSHPCPWMIQGCQFRGDVDQIKKHLNPNYQSQMINSGDPEEVVECFYNKFKEGSIKTAHCGECAEDLDLDISKVIEHIDADTKEFSELKKRIEEMEQEDSETKEELRSGDVSKQELIKHIEEDGKEFDELSSKIMDMKKEDEGFVGELTDDRRFVNSSSDFYSTDELSQLGIPDEDIDFVKFVDKHFNDSQPQSVEKTASHDPSPRQDFTQPTDPQFNRTEDLGLSEDDRKFVDFTNKFLQQGPVVTQGGSKKRRPGEVHGCAHCGADISKPYQSQRDRLWESNPYHHAMIQSLELLHHKDSTPEDRDFALKSLKSEHMIIPAYISSQKLCVSCNQSQQGHEGTIEEAVTKNRAPLSDEHRAIAETHDRAPVSAVRPPTISEFYEDHKDNKELLSLGSTKKKRFEGDKKFGVRSRLHKFFEQSARTLDGRRASEVDSVPQSTNAGMRHAASQHQVDFTRHIVNPLSDRLSALKERSSASGTGYKSYVDSIKKYQTSKEIPRVRYEDTTDAMMRESAFKRVIVSQDGGGGASGGDGGGAASGGDSGGGDAGSNGGDSGSEGGDSGLSVGPSGQGKTTDGVGTQGAITCPRCDSNTLEPINTNTAYSCYNCGYAFVPSHNVKKKEKRHSSWIEQSAPPSVENTEEILMEQDTTPVVPNLYVIGDGLNPAPGTQDNKIYHPSGDIAQIIQSPLTMVNASVHTAAPTIIDNPAGPSITGPKGPINRPHKKIWKRIHKVNIPNEGICPRCKKKINYLGLCNTCRLETGMQFHHWNAQDLHEGK